MKGFSSIFFQRMLRGTSVSDSSVRLAKGRVNAGRASHLFSLLGIGIGSALLLVHPSTAFAECVGGTPDGAVDPSEMCDDGNTQAGDGCSSACEVEAGFQCARSIDFANIEQHDFQGSTATWNIADDNGSGIQTQNASNPTVALFGENAFFGTYAVDVGVQSNEDNDFIGLVFGFNPGDQSNAEAEYLVLDWRQGAQNGLTPGMGLAHVQGAPNGQTHNTHDIAQRRCPGTPADACVTDLGRSPLYGELGWEDNTTYRFQVTYQPTRLEVRVNGLVAFDVMPSMYPDLFPEGVFPGGEFGFYTLSQEQSAFANLVPVGSSICNSTIIRDIDAAVVVGEMSVSVDVASAFVDNEDALDTFNISVVESDPRLTVTTPATGAGEGNLQLAVEDPGAEGSYYVIFEACDDHPVIPVCRTATLNLIYGVDEDGNGIPDVVETEPFTPFPVNGGGDDGDEDDEVDSDTPVLLVPDNGSEASVAGGSCSASASQTSAMASFAWFLCVGAALWMRRRSLARVRSRR